MAMVKLLVHLPKPLKAKLDALRTQGYTASGYIRALLERELNETQVAREGDGKWKEWGNQNAIESASMPESARRTKAKTQSFNSQT